jgi:hypothetical protein
VTPQSLGRSSDEGAREGATRAKRSLLLQTSSHDFVAQLVIWGRSVSPSSP